MGKVALKAKIERIQNKATVLFTETTQYVEAVLSEFSVFDQILVTIEKFKSKRSLEQNAYYWGVVVPHVLAYIKDTQGEEVSDKAIHAYHLAMVGDLKVAIVEILGVPVRVTEGKTTSEMNIKEMAEFLDGVVDHWYERDLEIPEPTTII